MEYYGLLGAIELLHGTPNIGLFLLLFLVALLKRQSVGNDALNELLCRHTVARVDQFELVAPFRLSVRVAAVHVICNVRSSVTHKIHFKMVHHLLGDGIRSSNHHLGNVATGENGQNSFVQVHNWIIGSFVMIHHRVCVKTHNEVVTFSFGLFQEIQMTNVK